MKAEYPWSELAERYSRYEERFNGDVPPPATDVAIEQLLVAARADGLVVPQEFLAFLKMRNGASFNGLMLYGAGIARDDVFRRADLALINAYQFHRDGATVLGTCDIDTYVVAGPHGPYRRLDRGSWDTIDEFATCDELLVSIFAAQLEALDQIE